MPTSTEERDEAELSPEDEAAAAAFNALPEEERDNLVALADAEGMTVEQLAESQGKTIEQLARERAEGGDEPEELPPMQIPIPGVIEGISTTVGGPKPTSSEARLVGASLPIEGQFPNDALVVLVVEARVSDVSFPIVRDEWGNVTKVTRRHLLRPVSVRRFE
jgi:hypothetical protein